MQAICFYFLSKKLINNITFANFIFLKNNSRVTTQLQTGLRLVLLLLDSVLMLIF